MAAPPFTRAVAYGLYDDQMREAIQAFKYDRVRVLARPLGAMLAKSIATLRIEAPNGMLLVPVPLHRDKRRQRGFNQARSLAVAALFELRKTQPDWPLTLAKRTLIRHKQTEAQAGLSPRSRRINLRGAFIVSNAEAVRMKDILLIDDILTTGATARSAADVLMKAGAASVRVATLSRALTHHWQKSGDDGKLDALKNKATRKMDGRLGSNSQDRTTH